MTAAAGAPPATPPDSDRMLGYIGWAAMVVGMFMAILDIQIVASSLNEIQAGLSASADEVKWVQTSYLIAEVVMIPLSGFLARFLGTRVLFTLSAAGFTVMSFFCAFADSLMTMIVFRALQGFLGGAMIPTVFSSLYVLFPPNKRHIATVVIGLTATMAPTLGPTLGGWITENVSWHWLFLVNIVPGVLVGTVVWLLVDVDRPDYSLRSGFDLIGLVLMAVFLGSLEYALDEGPANDWLQDETIAWAVGACISTGLLFFWRMVAYSRPIVDLRAFHDANFAFGCLFSFVMGIGLYGSVYILPVMLAQVRGFNALQIGTIMAVTGVCQFMTAPVIGRLLPKVDLRLLLAIGLVLFGLGLYLNIYNNAEVGFDELLVPQALRGFAIMFCMAPVNALALGTLPLHELKNASGLFNLMRNLGGAIGMAAISTVLDTRTDLHFARLADAINPGRPEVQARIEALAAHFGERIATDPTLAAIKTMGAVLHREAALMAFNDVFLVMAWVFFAALLFMPLVRRPRPASGGGGGH